MAQEKQIQIQFKLVDVQQIQFAVLTNEWPKGEMQITNQLQFNSDTDHRVVRCVANFEFKKNDITQLILVVQSVYEFSVDTWSALYNLQNDEWVLPAGLVQHLADITLGAARGILSVRTEENKATPRVLLPLINPGQIIQGNLRLRRNAAPAPEEPRPNNGEA